MMGGDETIIAMPPGFSKVGKTLCYRIAQNMKFSIKNFFSKCDQIAVSCGFGHI